MSKNSKTFSQYFAQYRDTIQTKLRSGDATELSYYGSLERLIEEIKPNLAVTSSAKGSQSTGINNKVDFTIKDKKSGVPKGHIEAKDIGISLNAIENSEQLQRYRRDFTNLILTDFIEFRWYIKGSLRKTIKIGSVSGNKLKINPNAEEEFQSFFEKFLDDNVTLITSPEDLALKLADKTKDIREKVKEELKNHVEDDSGPLDEMMEEFQKVLLKDLDGDKFSDILAQTLTYGLFAARVHHHNSDSKNEFSRLTAGQILPPTYQFLRKFLQEFVNERLPDSLLELTDDVMSVLLNTDIKTIMEALAKQGKEDAIIYFYENFLSAYDEDIRKQLGVYYTPNPVVDYMVRSIDEILQTKFGRKKGLADEKTLILDPALGTGSYLKKVIEEIKKKIPDNKWNDYVSDSLLNRIFGFEVLMAPYAIAHLKLGLQLESTGYKFKKDHGLGVYLTNTLEETAQKSEEVSLKFLKDEASGAFKIKRTQPIMVVIGNPPYSGESQNNGPWIRELMRGFDTLSNKTTHNYFECEGKPLGERNPKLLNDDYVKFIRFAQWRIEQTGHGVLAFITNNGYLDNPTFRGMRESLIEDFDEIYLLDLHGSSRKKETAPDGSKDENVFNIQTGVSICFLIRNENSNAKLKRNAKVFKFDLYGEQDKKYEWLNENSFLKTNFKEIKVISPYYLYVKQNQTMFKEYEKGFSVKKIFPVNSTGIKTGNDDLCIQLNKIDIWTIIKKFYSLKGGEGCKKDYINKILYRPFDYRYTYYSPDSSSNGFISRPRSNIMYEMLTENNIALVTPRTTTNSFNHIFLSNTIIDGNISRNYSYLYPLYINNTSTIKNTKINFSEEIQQILTQTYKQPIESLARPFFNYIYAIFHAPSFRTRYAEFLKQDFPKVQITPDKKLFDDLADLGQKLVNLHLLQDKQLEKGKTQFKDEGLLKNAPKIVSKVTYDSKSQKVFINENHYFSNIDEETFQFQIGGYQVLHKWLKDRKARTLTSEDISHYIKVAESLKITQKLMFDIDDIILKAGGWPLVKEELELMPVLKLKNTQKTTKSNEKPINPRKKAA